MGMTTADLPLHIDIATGSSYRISNSPVNHLIASKTELEQSFGLYQGSGGMITGFFSTTLSGANNVPAAITPPANRLADIVNHICMAFGLTKDELTKVCKIQSQKTLYHWIDGVSTPRNTAMNRMFDLALIAQAWRQSGFSNDKALLHQPILDGSSVLDLLTNHTLDKDLILFAGTRLNLLEVKPSSLEDPFA